MRKRLARLLRNLAFKIDPHGAVGEIASDHVTWTDELGTEWTYWFDMNPGLEVRQEARTMGVKVSIRGLPEAPEPNPYRRQLH